MVRAKPGFFNAMYYIAPYFPESVLYLGVVVIVAVEEDDDDAGGGDRNISQGRPGTHYTAEDDLECLIFLPPCRITGIAHYTWFEPVLYLNYFSS